MTTYGIIGYPLGHSFSPAYFSEKFMSLGLTDHSYKVFEIRDLRKLHRLLAGQPELKGFNVTIPYKKEIMGYLDHLHDSAIMTGNVNVVKIKDGSLIGYNTDFKGVEQCLLPLIAPGMNDALILGSGGSAGTVAYVLGALGMHCTFVSRKPRNIHHLRYEDVDESLLNSMDVVVNCTPCGMYPNTTEKPKLPYEALHAEQILFDLIYNPEVTSFLKEGLARGTRVLNGLEMLRIQAEASWEIWNCWND